MAHQRIPGGAPHATAERPPRHAPDDTVIYAIGDIHGRSDLLSRLNDRIRGDAAARPQSRKVIVHLGDYVDRGLASRQVIDMLLDEGHDGMERVYLKGNHEDTMLRFMDGEDLGWSWMSYGGEATLRSYDVDPWCPPPGGAGGMERIRDELCRNLPKAHRDFLDALVLSHQEGDYFFVHAGVRPGMPLDRQHPEDMVWIRHEFLDSSEEFGKLVVHGHTIERQPAVRKNRIGIDTGAFMTGVLTCLVLWDTHHAFLQTP